MPKSMQFLTSSGVESMIKPGRLESLAEVIPIMDVLGIEGTHASARSLCVMIVLHYIIVVFDY